MAFHKQREPPNLRFSSFKLKAEAVYLYFFPRIPWGGDSGESPASAAITRYSRHPRQSPFKAHLRGLWAPPPLPPSLLLNISFSPSLPPSFLLRWPPPPRISFPFAVSFALQWDPLPPQEFSRPDGETANRPRIAPEGYFEQTVSGNEAEGHYKSLNLPLDGHQPFAQNNL